MDKERDPRKPEDVLLGRAVGQELEEAAASELRAFEDGPYDRPELDSRLRRVIWGYRVRRVLARTAKAAAALALVAAVSVSLLYLQAEAFRETVRTLFTREYALFTDFGSQYDGEELKAAGFLYAPSYVPEGYTASTIWSDANAVSMQYIAATGEPVWFNQYGEESRVGLDRETEYTQIWVGETEGYLITGKGNVLLWAHGGLYFELLNTGLEAEELVRMAESLHPL